MEGQSDEGEKEFFFDRCLFFFQVLHMTISSNCFSIQGFNSLVLVNKILSIINFNTCFKESGFKIARINGREIQFYENEKKSQRGGTI